VPSVRSRRAARRRASSGGRSAAAHRPPDRADASRRAAAPLADFAATRHVLRPGSGHVIDDQIAFDPHAGTRDERGVERKPVFKKSVSDSAPADGQAFFDFHANAKSQDVPIHEPRHFVELRDLLDHQVILV